MRSTTNFFNPILCIGYGTMGNYYILIFVTIFLGKIFWTSRNVFSPKGQRMCRKNAMMAGLSDVRLGRGGDLSPISSGSRSEGGGFEGGMRERRSFIVTSDFRRSCMKLQVCDVPRSPRVLRRCLANVPLVGHHRNRRQMTSCIYNTGAPFEMWNSEFC